MDNPEQNLNLKTKRSKKRKIVLVVLALLIVAGASYGSWRFVIKPKIDPTADWQLFYDRKAGYSIKHPADFTVKDIEIKEGEPNSEGVISCTRLKKQDDEDTTVIMIVVYENPNKLDPRKWKVWRFGDFISDSLKFCRDTFVNGMPAIRFDLEDEVSREQFVVVTIKNKAFDIHYIDTHDINFRQKNNEIFEQMLKTFRAD